MGHILNEKLVRKVAYELRAIRKSRGLTQETVCNDTGIHAGRVEMGKLNITISTLSRLCDYYGVSLQDFFKELGDVH